MHYSFDDRPSGKLPPGCTESSMNSDDVSIPWVLNRSELACFRELGTDEKYEHITPSIRVFLLQNLHSVNVFLSNNSVLSYKTYCGSTARHLQRMRMTF